MNGRIVRVLLWAGLMVLLNTALFAQERWVYLYDHGCSFDDANSVIMGSDGNIYAAGWSGSFAVLSVTDSGTERWVYHYEVAGHDEWANSVIMGSDGNLYAVGRSFGSGGLADFTVVSLTASGEERWVYRCEGSCVSSWRQDAHSIVLGPDANLYAIGTVCRGATDYDFTVVSLTPSGVEHWVYSYDGPHPPGSEDVAYSIAIGSDGNLYAAGSSDGAWTSEDFIVISLTDSGVERWVYRYDYATRSDIARAIAVGPDGNVYAAGTSIRFTGGIELAIISLTSNGEERWVYRCPGDELNSIIVGSDGNIYAVGVSGGVGTHDDFTVISLTDSGVERWLYRYPGPGNDIGHSIVMGADSNLYVAGYTRGSGASFDFTVVRLTTAGTERWVYSYPSPEDNIGRPNSVVFGSDGNLYAAGHTWGGDSTYTDIMVLSLSPDVGVEEGLNRLYAPGFHLIQNSPNPFHKSIAISYSLPLATHVTLSIYDISGRLVETLVNETQQPRIHHFHWDRKGNPSGVYFCRLRAGGLLETGKMVVVD